MDKALHLLVLAIDSILIQTFRLLCRFPWRPVLVFSSLVLFFRVPCAMWNYPLFRGSGVLIWMFYILWAPYIGCKYVYEPTAWNLEPRLPTPLSQPWNWELVWVWNIVAIIAIIVCEVSGPTEPLVLSRV
ncbi:hypothetical protein BJ170DRAFT_681188 [Xylariales sp. AK1849]|nr:hypothetical protein BJ170DRAFT_681188 [Xylariales sp. AK1849]